MALTVAQSQKLQGSATTTGITATFANNLTAGNYVLCIVVPTGTTYALTTPGGTVADAGGWTALKLGDVLAGQSYPMYAWYCKAAGGANKTVIVKAASGTGVATSTWIIEVSGANTPPSISVRKDNTSVSTITANAQACAIGDLIVALHSRTSRTVSTEPASPWTTLGDAGLAAGYNHANWIVATTTSYTPTWGLSGSANAAAAYTILFPGASSPLIAATITAAGGASGTATGQAPLLAATVAGSGKVNQAPLINPAIPSITEVQTTNLVEGRLHGLIYVANRRRIYGSSQQGFIVSLNADDLTDQKESSFVPGKYQLMQLCYVASTDRIYCCAGIANYWRIYSIHPDTLAMTLITDINESMGVGTGQSICSDGTYLYVVNSDYAEYNTRVRKFALSGSPASATILMSGYNYGHACIYDAATSKLFVTGASIPGFLARFDPATMALEDVQTLDAGDGACTDDLSIQGDYLWIGLESSSRAAPDNDKLVFRVQKTDLTNRQYFKMGVTGVATYGTYYDGDAWVWTVFGTSAPGVGIIAVNVSTFAVTQWPTPYAAPNEIVYDGANYYVTYWNAQTAGNPSTPISKFYINFAGQFITGAAAGSASVTADLKGIGVLAATLAGTSTAQLTVTIPSFGGTVAATLPKLTAAMAGARAVPSYSGSAASTLQKLQLTASGARVVPSYTSTVASTLKKLGATAAGARVVPAYSGTSALALKKLTITAAGTSAVPNYTGIAASSLKKVTAALAGARAIPAYGGTAGLALKKITAALAGTSSVPAYSGAASATLKKLSAVMAGASTVPAYSGTANLLLKKLAMNATGTQAVWFGGTVAASFRKLQLIAAGSSAAPQYSGVAALGLKKLSAALSGTSAVPSYSGTIAASLRKLSLNAASSLVLSGSIAGSLRKLQCSTVGVGAVPQYTGTVQAQLHRLACVGGATRSVPVVTAAGALTLRLLRAQITALYDAPGSVPFALTCSSIECVPTLSVFEIANQPAVSGVVDGRPALTLFEISAAPELAGKTVATEPALKISSIEVVP